MRVDRPVFTHDIHPSGQLIARECNELDVLTAHVVHDERAGLFDWRSLEEREIPSLARDRIEDAMEVGDMFFRDRDDSDVHSKILRVQCK
jgi:hypothetical protein